MVMISVIRSRPGVMVRLHPVAHVSLTDRGLADLRPERRSLRKGCFPSSNPRTPLCRVASVVGGVHVPLVDEHCEHEGGAERGFKQLK